MDPAFGNILGMLAQQGHPALGQGQMGNSFGALSGGQPMGFSPSSLSSIFGGNNTLGANPLQSAIQNGMSGFSPPQQFNQGDHWQSLISTLMQRLVGGPRAGGGGMSGSQFFSPSNMGGSVPDMSGGLFGNAGALGAGSLAPTFSFSGLYSR